MTDQPAARTTGTSRLNRFATPVALLAGLLYPLAFAPWAFWPLMPVSIALLWLCLHNATPRQALLRGWLYGLGMFGFGVSWVHVSMHDYGATPLWLAVPMTGLFAAFLALFPGLLSGFTIRLARHQALSPLLFAGAWVILDALRGWLLTGFPWLYAGYPMIDTALMGLAPLGGIWLLTLVTVLTGTALGAALLRQKTAVAAGVLALVGWGTGLVTDPLQFTEPAAEPTRVALPQGNIPQDLRWQLSMREATRDIYAELTARIPPHHLVIWPESALTEFLDDAAEFLLDQGELLAGRDSTLITGIPTRERRGFDMHYFNSIAVISGGDGIYHKQKLVPFGEYVPLQSLLRGLIPFFDLPMSSFTKGDPDQPNLLAMYMVVSPFICYEILYPELVAERANNSNVLITVSNDAWFGTSAGPHQHFQMARLRAVETGRWLLRSTNNGITAIVDPHGQVTARLPQFTRDVLLGEFVPMSGQTPYMMLGGWPVWGLAFLLCVTALVRRKA